MGWFDDFWSRIFGPKEIEGTNNNDTLEDTRRDDVITGLAGDDVVYTTYGDDVISGGRGEDTLYIQGNLEDYTLERLRQTSDGRFEDDPWYIRSEEYGDKELSSIEYIVDETGQTYNTLPYNTIQTLGTAQADIIFDNPFDDYIFTDSGDDYIYLSGIGLDTVNGGDGVDTVVLPGNLSDYRVYGQGRLVLHNTELGRETIYQTEYLIDASGNSYDISISDEAYYVYGNNEDDTLQDTAETDFITGYDGDDIMYTTTGNDTIIGGYGDDTLFVSGDLEDYEIIRGQQGNVELILLSEEYGNKLVYDTEFIGSLDGDAVLSVEDMFA